MSQIEKRENEAVEGFLGASSLVMVGRGRFDSLMYIFWSDVKRERERERDLVHKCIYLLD